MSAAFKSFGRSARRRAAAGCAFCLIGAALFSSPATACDLRLIQPPQSIRIDYDPFEIARPPGRLDLRLANDGPDACELEIRIRDATGRVLSGIDLGGVGVAFRPRESSALIARGEVTGVFSLRIPAGQSAAAQIDAVVVRDAVAEAGEHGVDLFLDVAPRDGEPLLRGLAQEMRLVSPARAQLNIAGAAGAFGSGESVEMIDFGEARTGAIKRAYLQVRANTDARLTFQSENAGVLRREDGGAADSVIAYSLALDGEAIDLGHTTVREIDPPRDLNGRSLALDFALGPVGSQMSGRYRDLITINISPR